MNHPITPFLGLFALLMIGACARQEGPFLLGEISANSPSITPMIAYPEVISESLTTRYYLAEDGAVFREVVEPTSDPDTLAKITRFEDDQIVLVRTIVGTEDGGIGVSEVLEADRGLVTTFTPALVLMPGELGGEPFEQNVRITVSPQDDPTVVERKGTGELVMRLANLESASDQIFDRVTHGVISVMDLSFPPATVKRRSGRFFDTTGLIEEAWDERIVVFGITSDQEQRRLVIDKKTHTLRCGPETGSSEISGTRGF